MVDCLFLPSHLRMGFFPTLYSPYYRHNEYLNVQSSIQNTPNLEPRLVRAIDFIFLGRWGSDTAEDGAGVFSTTLLDCMTSRIVFSWIGTVSLPQHFGSSWWRIVAFDWKCPRDAIPKLIDGASEKRESDGWLFPWWYCPYHQDDGDGLLLASEFVHNSASSEDLEGLEISPFEVDFGWQPRTALDFISSPEAPVQSVAELKDNWKKSLEDAHFSHRAGKAAQPAESVQK